MTLLWFVQTLQLPPFAFRRRPTPSRGLPWPGMCLHAGARLSWSLALCPPVTLDVLRLTHQRGFCDGASAPLLCTWPPLPHSSGLSWDSSWERPVLIFPSLHHSYFLCTLTVICVFYLSVYSFTYLFISCCRHCDKSFMWWQRPCVWFFIVSPQPKIVLGAPVIVKWFECTCWTEASIVHFKS